MAAADDADEATIATPTSASTQALRPPPAVEDLLRWLKLAASVAYTASTDAEAFQGAVDLVCEQTGWPVGHVLRTDGATGVLVSTGIWYDAHPQRHEAFVTASATWTFRPGQGLPGRIQATGESAWIVDVADDDGFARRAAALASGLHAGFGFPILSSRGLEGVMEFFSPHAAPADERLLDVLSHVGLHLGGVLDKVRAQGSLQASEARLRNLVESAPDALIVVDEQGDIVLANAEAERLTGYTRRNLVGRSVDTLVPDSVKDRHATDGLRTPAILSAGAWGWGRTSCSVAVTARRFPSTSASRPSAPRAPLWWRPCGTSRSAVVPTRPCGPARRSWRRPSAWPTWARGAGTSRRTR